MRKSKLVFVSIALLGLILGLIVSFFNHQLIFADETGFRDYDKHKAINTCMEKIYLERYQYEAAEQDAFYLCEQRYRELTQTLSHVDFLQAKNQTPIQQADGHFAPNIYYDTLFDRVLTPAAPPDFNLPKP